MKSQIVKFLLDHQNIDGSWGYFPGKAGATEPTAYALMSLALDETARKSIERGLAFLERSQTARGGWPISTQDSEAAAWATAIAGLALLGFDGTERIVNSAAQFVVDSFGAHPRPWVLRLADWMRSFDSAYVEENLRGWKWNPGTANWVEPTSYALMFLKRFKPSIERGSNERKGDWETIKPIVAEAESLLYQRMCKEGGWNYGNARVLGEELRPYPLTTAIALVAMQNPSSAECQRSLAYLRRAMRDERSALALCMGVHCFNLYGIEADPWMRAITAHYSETGFFQSIKTSAMAVLALQSLSGKNAFRISS